MIKSWGNHGYSTDGSAKRLPGVRISRNSFSHNYPDVKQCGMGGGNRMAFQWNMQSPYWRSTQELFNQASDSNDQFIDEGFVRWDEQFGRIGLYGDDAEVIDQYDNQSAQTNGVVCPMGYVKTLNRNVRNPLTTNAQSFWVQMEGGNTNCGSGSGGLNCPAGACTNATKGVNQYYRDPEPMPKLYLMLQPQLSAIEAGVGNAVAQIQFEVHVDVELMGQCPSVLEGGTVSGQSLPERALYGRRWINNMAWKMPIYYPIVVSDDFTSENES